MRRVTSIIEVGGLGERGGLAATEVWGIDAAGTLTQQAPLSVRHIQRLASRRLRPEAVRTGGGPVSGEIVTGYAVLVALTLAFVVGGGACRHAAGAACRHDARCAVRRKRLAVQLAAAFVAGLPSYCSCRAGCCPPPSWAAQRSGRPRVGWAVGVA